MTPDRTPRGTTLRGDGGRVIAWLGSPALHAALLVIATLTAWLSLGLRDAPISGDQAYFTYMGQSVLRGDSVYANTFLTYPPLMPLASAASMLVGSWAGVPSYMAPRYLAVLLGVLSVLLLYGITRRATASSWAGLVAGLVLAGFQLLAASYLSTLQHKHLVIFFSLLAGAACQRRRWGMTGFAAGLAVSSYQPALLVPLGFGVIACWDGLGRGIRSPAAYAIGVLIGLLPIPLYLAAVGGWEDFWLRAVLVPASRMSRAGSTPGHWIDVLIRAYRTDLPLFVAAAIGWLGFGLQSVISGGRRALGVWLAPENAGMPLLAALWCLSAMFQFQGHPDAYPLLPLAAYWTAWLVHESVEIATSWRPLGARPLDRRVTAVLGALAVLIAALFGFRDVSQPPRRYTLSEQVHMVRGLWGSPGQKAVALFAEEVYVLAEQRSPFPFLRLPGLFVPYLPSVGLRDCKDVAARILGERPRSVALRINPILRGCEPVIGRLLVARGYRRTRGMTLLIYWAPGVIPPFQHESVRGLAPSSSENAESPVVNDLGHGGPARLVGSGMTL